MHKKLHLLFVAYHPGQSEVSRVRQCLSELSSDIEYSVVVNDYTPGEPVECLFDRATTVLCESKNYGYGRAINLLFSKLIYKPEYIAVLNTDITWSKGTFLSMYRWINSHPDVSLIVPKILSPDGYTQKLCKQVPTVLGLFSRRFFPESIKPDWLKRYDSWYTMSYNDYNTLFESSYLSGCCMVVKTSSFVQCGGFDERYFLYLEDADLTRSLLRYGRCIHFPYASVVHNWGKGNYRSFRLMFVNLISAFKYFSKWGLKLW